MSFDDRLALLGLISLLTGVFLWLGLPATLILLGLVLIFIGARINVKPVKNEPNQTTHQS